MGLENSEHGNFLTIGNGKICKQVKTPSKTSVERKNKNDKIVHEEFYDKISGIITNITTKEHDEFGRFWMVTLQDGDEKFILQLNYSSGYSSAFLKTLPNVNLEERVTLIPKLTMDGLKKKVTMFINQGGHALKHAYTKDSPNGLPAMIKKEGKGKDKGKITWDDSEMMEFLEQMVKDEILPKLGQGEAVDASPDEEML